MTTTHHTPATAAPPDATPIIEGHRYFSPAVERVLLKTPLSAWSQLAVLLDTESRVVSIMSRGELAGWLRANDLPDQAREAMSRRVRPGCLLVLVLRDEGPHFRVLFDTPSPMKGARHAAR